MCLGMQPCLDGVGRVSLVCLLPGAVLALMRLVRNAPRPVTAKSDLSVSAVVCSA